MSQNYYCSERGCTKHVLAFTSYCLEHVNRSARDIQPSKLPIHANPMAVLKPALQAMIPGDRFRLTFYGKAQLFAFEAWEGHNVVARPSAQPWALVRIPLTDLVTFNATVTKQDF